MERLKRRFGPTLTEVLEHEVSLIRDKSNLQNLDEKIDDLKRDFNKSLIDLKVRAAKLSEQRHELAKKVETWIKDELKDLSLKQAQFVIQINVREFKDFASFGPDGLDEVTFLISPNPGPGLKPLHLVASGGETSRLFLALKNVLTRHRRYGTLVFDEIDTGISGAVVELTGKKLKSLSGRFQVLCITHHAQIASLADTHYHVAKEVKAGQTITRVKILSEEERVEELSRLLGGVNVTSKTRELARELRSTPARRRSK